MKALEFDTSVERTASCLIYSKDSQKFLFIQRSSYEDSPLTWTLPGGHLEEGEDYLQAAIRECHEEAGIDLSDVPNKLIYSVKTDWPLIIHRTFAFQIDKEIEPKLSWESVAFKWCTLDEDDMPMPLHWSVEQMLNSDSAAERLHDWLKNN